MGGESQKSDPTLVDSVGWLYICIAAYTAYICLNISTRDPTETLRAITALSQLAQSDKLEFVREAAGRGRGTTYQVWLPSVTAWPCRAGKSLHIRLGHSSSQIERFLRP